MYHVNDKFRMSVWLIIGLALYAASILLGSGQPAIQTILYKLGHVTTLAWFGYWVSRHALGRISSYSNPQDRIARAIVIVGVLIAGAMGL